jgi:hypothetical protein
MKVTLPNKTLGPLDEWGAMGYLYGGAYRVRIPWIVVRDISLMEDQLPY